MARRECCGSGVAGARSPTHSGKLGAVGCTRSVAGGARRCSQVAWTASGPVASPRAPVVRGRKTDLSVGRREIPRQLRGVNCRRLDGKRSSYPSTNPNTNFTCGAGSCPEASGYPNSKSFHEAGLFSKTRSEEICVHSSNSCQFVFEETTGHNARDGGRGKCLPS